MTPARRCSVASVRPQATSSACAEVDADGTWLAIAVVPASAQARDTLPTLDDGKAQWPSLREAILDGAFVAERCREWSNG